jgi:hypothetical protein
MTEDARARRRKSRTEEWRTHTRLAALLQEYLNPATTFWTSLENRPRPWLSGILQKKRACGAGFLT